MSRLVSMCCSAALVLFYLSHRISSLSYEPFHLCDGPNSYQTAPLNKSGIIKFDKTYEQDINCVVDLTFNSALTDYLVMVFMLPCESFLQSCPLPATIELETTAGIELCPTSPRHTFSFSLSSALSQVELKVFGHNSPPLNSFSLIYYTREKTQCDQTVTIGEYYYNYSGIAYGPFFETRGKAFISCRHTINGIPEGAYVAYSRMYQWGINLHSSALTEPYGHSLIVANGTHNEPLYTSVIMKGNGENNNSIALDITIGNDSSWWFLYRYKVLICEDPPEVANGRYESHIWLNGTSVTYTCDQGFQLRSSTSSTKTCTLIGTDVYWSNETVDCLPVKTCGEAPNLPSTVKQLDTSGAMVTYTCDLDWAAASDPYILQCVSPDPQSTLFTWQPVSITPLMCASKQGLFGVAGTIAFITMAGVMLITLIVIVICYVRRRKRSQSDTVNTVNTATREIDAPESISLDNKAYVNVYAGDRGRAGDSVGAGGANRKVNDYIENTSSANPSSCPHYLPMSANAYAEEIYENAD